MEFYIQYLEVRANCIRLFYATQGREVKIAAFNLFSNSLEPKLWVDVHAEISSDCLGAFGEWDGAMHKLFVGGGGGEPGLIDVAPGLAAGVIEGVNCNELCFLSWDTIFISHNGIIISYPTTSNN